MCIGPNLTARQLAFRLDTFLEQSGTVEDDLRVHD
jgi:hypothetical protein